MLHSLDKSITKVAITMQQKYLQHDVQLESKVSSEYSSSQLIRKQYPRSAAMFVRNIIRNVLRKHFRRMLSRIMMKRACWRLIKSVRRRDMERAFLSILNHTNNLALRTLHKFYQRLPQLRIMISLCSRIFLKPQRSAISAIRSHSLRRNRVRAFTSKLEAHLTRATFRQGARRFWSILVIDRTRQRQQELGTEAIVRWTQSKKASFLRQCLNWIAEWVLMNSCNKDVQQWRNKKQKVADGAQNRKKKMAKLRQDIKQLKTEYEQQKAARYKVYQEHKKVSHANKAEMTELVRQFEKEKKVQQANFNQVRSELQEWQRVLNARKCYSLMEKEEGSGPVDVCFSAYKALSEAEQQFRKIQQVLPNVSQGLTRFKGSSNFYFLSNLEMGRLVDVYQKRQPYNYQAEYYELQYENRVVRETMRCFVRQKYEAYMSRLRWGHPSKSPSQLLEGTENQVQ